MPLGEDLTRHLEHAAEARRLAKDAESQAQALAFLELADLWPTRAQQLASQAAPVALGSGLNRDPPSDGGRE